MWLIFIGVFFILSSVIYYLRYILVAVEISEELKSNKYIYGSLYDFKGFSWFYLIANPQSVFAMMYGNHPDYIKESINLAKKYYSRALIISCVGFAYGVACIFLLN